MRYLLLAGLALALAACGTTEPPETPGTSPVAGSYKVGKPYKIDGRWYYPSADPSYDRVGTASWYGADFHGLKTANGEVFDMNRISAAHPTLPLPSLVRVTNLENGRSLVLRVNDRGPFVEDRLIDLSQAAARELGYERNGLAKVRVQFVQIDDGRAPSGQASAPASRGRLSIAEPPTVIAAASLPVVTPPARVQVAAREVAGRLRRRPQHCRAVPPAAGSCRWAPSPIRPACAPSPGRCPTSGRFASSRRSSAATPWHGCASAPSPRASVPGRCWARSGRSATTKPSSPVAPAAPDSASADPLEPQPVLSA